MFWMEMLVTVSILLVTIANTCVQSDVVLVGKSADFSCIVNNPCRAVWDRTPILATEKDENIPIYNGIEVNKDFKDHFRVNSSDVVSRLFILRVTKSDAGLYFCSDEHGDKMENYSLTVIDSEPRCVLDDRLQYIECQVCYFGQTTPNWTCLNSHVNDWRKETENNLSAPSLHGNSSSCTLSTSLIQPPPRRFQGSVFTCSVISESQHAANYSYTWKSPAINYEYGPSSVQINASNDTSSFKHRDKITCSAEANPEPVYQWETGKNIIRGPEYVVDICSLVSSPRDWNGDAAIVKEVKCVAMHSVGNATDSVSITITRDLYRINCDNQDVHINIAAAVTGTVIAAAAAVAIIAFIVRKKRCGCNTRRAADPDIIPAAPQHSDEARNNGGVQLQMLAIDASDEPIPPPLPARLHLIGQSASNDSSIDEAPRDLEPAAVEPEELLQYADIVVIKKMTDERTRRELGLHPPAASSDAAAAAAAAAAVAIYAHIDHTIVIQKLYQ